MTADNFGPGILLVSFQAAEDVPNKEEYMRLIDEYKLVLSVESYLDSITQGLYEVNFKSWA